MEYLVEASAAEAEAISATLAAAKARQLNGDAEQLPDMGHGSEATPSGKQISSLIKVPDTSLPNNSTSAGVRLHHRAVSMKVSTCSQFCLYFISSHMIDLQGTKFHHLSSLKHI